MLGVDPALDGMTDDLDLVWGRRQFAAGSDPDLFEHEVDVGDHLGHGMFDLEFPVFISMK